MKLKHNSKQLNRAKVQRDLATAILIIVVTLIVGHYVDQQRIISPIPDNPIITTVKASDCDKTTKDCIISKSKHPAQIYHIWGKETTYGTNTNPQALHNICKAQGKTNEFGYGGMAMMICFDSFQEAVDKVDAWLTKRDNEALCYYNKGERLQDCEYLK